jgi:hypothetical protein
LHLSQQSGGVEHRGPPADCISSAICWGGRASPRQIAGMGTCLRASATRGLHPGPREFASVQPVLACSRRRGPPTDCISSRTPRIVPPEGPGSPRIRITPACPRLFAPTAFPRPLIDHDAQARTNSWGGLWWGGTACPDPRTDHEAHARAKPFAGPVSQETPHRCGVADVAMIGG